MPKRLNLYLYTFLMFFGVTAYASDPVLTVTGLPPDGAQEMSFDIEALKLIDDTSFETSTNWTEGQTQFRGVRLAALLQHLGVTEGTIDAIAANDYSAEFSVEEELQNDAIIAFEKDGKLMSLRDKGPLWLVYPYDQNVKYQSEDYYSRSIWQLVKIAVHK